MGIKVEIRAGHKWPQTVSQRACICRIILYYHTVSLIPEPGADPVSDPGMEQTPLTTDTPQLQNNDVDGTPSSPLA